MAEKSPRRQQLERSLADDPRDGFLRYGLALQCLREGDLDEGRRRLEELIAEDPDGQVAAYQQLGQSLMETGEHDRAGEVLRRGVEEARRRGDAHAAAEMDGLLAILG